MATDDPECPYCGSEHCTGECTEGIPDDELDGSLDDLAQGEM